MEINDLAFFHFLKEKHLMMTRDDKINFICFKCWLDTLNTFNEFISITLKSFKKHFPHLFITIYTFYPTSFSFFGW